MKCDAHQYTGPLFNPAEPNFLYSYYVSAEYIREVKVDGEIISGIFMSHTGKWKMLLPEKNGGSFFEQELWHANGRKRYNQTLFLKFEEYDIYKHFLKMTKLIAAACCQLTFVHFYENGLSLIQGIEIDPLGRGGFTVSKLQPAKLMPFSPYKSIDDESPFEWNVTSVSADLAPRTSLTAADLEAL